MNTKKFISFISAAALTVGCFGGISVQAKETTATVGHIYMANDIFPKWGNTDTLAVDSSQADYYNKTLKAPFGTFEDITSADFPTQTSSSGKDTFINDSDGKGSKLNYKVSTAGDYTFSVLVVEYDKRYPDIYVDNEQKIDGGSLSGLTKIGSYGSTSRKLAVIQVPLKNLSADNHTIKFTAENQVQGVIAAVLKRDAEASATATPQPTETSVPQAQAVTYRYSASNDDVINGNECGTDYDLLFFDGVDSNLASFFADSTDSTKLDWELVKYNKNYICGTASNGTHPSIKATLPAGNYKIYYLGYDNECVIKASLEKSGTSFKSVDGAQTAFAKVSDHPERVLKLYTIDIKVDSSVTDETITFDTTNQWLPDLYAIVVTNQEKYGETTEATATPQPTVAPGTPVTQAYKADGSEISTGSVNTTSNNDDYVLADGMEDIVYDIFENKSDTSKVNSELIKKYINYIGVGSSSKGNPRIKGLNLPAGNYKIYYVGNNNDNTGIKAVLGDLTGEVSSKQVFATGDKELKLYTIDLTVPTAVTNGTLEFAAASDYWLPDLYAAAITNQAAPISVPGTISSADAYNYSGTNLIFTSKHGKEYSAAVGENNSFTLSAPVGTYTVRTDDIYHVVSASFKVTITSDTDSIAVTAENETAKNVTVNLINPPAEGTTIKFGETDVVFAAGEASKTVSLNPGKYIAASTKGTMSELSQTELIVAHEDTYKNIYYPETIIPATSKNIRVDNTAVERENVYNSISNALAAASAGNISAPIITVTSGQTYQEQVKIDMPNVTIKTSGEEKAVITWYYGVGQAYYSVGKDGLYNKDRAMTKIGYMLDDNSGNTNDTDGPILKGAARWGGTIYVSRYGEGFKMENITAINSFNKEVTALELADGVTPNHAASTGQKDRTVSGFKASSTANVERAAAIVFVDSPKRCELYDCDFISSQDTFYTSGSLYARNCKIQGNVDYIFGGGKIVFDDCRLVWNSFEDGSIGGYISAPYTGEGESYVFRNCTIENEGTAGGGALGRDWGGTKALSNVYFINTVDNTSNTNYKWSNMGGTVENETANMHIYDFDPVKNEKYNSTGKDGANVNGLLTFAAAKEVYEGISDSLGFVPSRLTNAKTSKVEGGVDDGDSDKYVYGIVTTVKSGSGASVSGIKWTITNGTNVYTATTDDAFNAVGNGVAGDKFPTITGAMEVNVAMLFHAPQGSYDVLSEAK